MGHEIAIKTMLSICAGLMEQDIADMQAAGMAPEALRKPIAIRNILAETSSALVDTDRGASFKRLMNVMNHTRQGMGMTSRVVVLDPDEMDDNQIAAADVLIKKNKKKV